MGGKALFLPKMTNKIYYSSTQLVSECHHTNKVHQTWGIPVIVILLSQSDRSESVFVPAKAWALAPWLFLVTLQFK